MTKGAAFWRRRKMNSDVYLISPSKRWGTIASTPRLAWRLSVISQSMRSPSTNRAVLPPRITIRKSIDPSTKIVLRRGEIMQVISNLIANSIYAMPDGGTLSLSVCDASSTGNGVVLTVEDDGVGIRPKDLPKVFDAFFTTRTTVGTGIGLFVAKQFVEGHGGRISIESDSESEKHGTTVRVFLPLHTAYE